MAKVKSLEDVLMYELKDLYSAETQIVKALPRMIGKASNPSLQDALSNHLNETKEQVSRLDQIAKSLDWKLSGETCEGMQGLLEEGEEALKASDDANLRDALIIGSLQRVEHYEMAGYGTARTIAEYLGLNEVTEMLQSILEEERQADKHLSSISEQQILCACAGAMEQSDEEDEDDDDKNLKRSNLSSSSSSSRNVHGNHR